MKRWVKVWIVVMVVQGVLAMAKTFMQWQWDHTAAPYCWNPYMVEVDQQSQPFIVPSVFFTPYLNDWISWIPPFGWKTGVYVYNALNPGQYLLTILMFVTTPLVVYLLRKHRDLLLD